MKHFVLNGCSYAHYWHSWNQLASRLGAETSINLARPGSSNDRILRTTFEYVLNNPQTDFVLIMLTFNARYEAPWRINRGSIEGSWLTYTPMGVTMNWRDDEPDIDLSTVARYIEDKFKYDHNMAYTEKTLNHLLLLTNWFKSHNIDYCVFNTCDEVYTTAGFNSIPTYKSKLDLVAMDPNIIDLRNFISNQWMYDNGAQIPESEQHVEPKSVHYAADGYTMLSDYIYNYINDK